MSATTALTGAADTKLKTPSTKAANEVVMLVFGGYVVGLIGAFPHKTATGEYRRTTPCVRCPTSSPERSL
ncbi:hypothetical protein SBBP2_680020 [Burkholderiales bacterium]|nr:hypothetical protein SBBP2_680020 [Burkholderiales bacterium]